MVCLQAGVVLVVTRNFPELTIIIIVPLMNATNEAQAQQNETRDGAGSNSNSERNTNGSQLNKRLVFTVLIFRDVSCFVLGDAKSGKDGDNRTQDTRHSVKVVHTTGIVQVEVMSQSGGEEDVTKSGNKTSDHTTSNGGGRVKVQMRSNTHNHTTSQCSVLDVHRIETSLTKETRNNEGHHGSTTEREEGVDDRSHALDTSRSDRGVEGRPKEPQEESTSISKQIASVASDVIRMSLSMCIGQEEANRKSEIGAIHVDVVATTNINSVQLQVADEEDKPEEERLDDGHDGQLEGSAFTQDGTERDENSSRAEHTIKDFMDTDGNTLTEVAGFVKGGKENLTNDGPLDHKGSQQECHTNRRITISSREGHQETKSEEDHDSYISVKIIQVFEFMVSFFNGCVVKPHRVNHYHEHFP